MSDCFEMLVDPQVSTSDAEGLSLRVLDMFRSEGLITGNLSADCVLGGSGFMPGPRIPKIYRLFEREYPFWKLRTCGVEPKVGPGFNVFAIGPVCEGLTCPQCGATITHSSNDGDEFGDRLGNAISAWHENANSAMLSCTRCSSSNLLADWECKPPLGLRNLAFVFWNWPPLMWDSWAISIPGLLHDITGHNIVHTHGRL